MNQRLNLKEILLEKLNRVLNPNFEAKFIGTVLAAGIALLGYQRLLQLASSLELFTKEVHVKLSLSSGTDTIFVLVGALMISTSCFLFWTKYSTTNKTKKSKNYKNLSSASKDLRPILEENRRIFNTFGPNSDAGSTGELRHDYNVWNRLKSEQIVPNNIKILDILNNTETYKADEISHIEKMKSHIQAFEDHCKNPKFDYSNNQFPIGFSDLIMEYCANKKTVNFNKYSEWISQEVGTLDLNTEEIYIFGSALYGQEKTDVDMIIKTLDKNITEIKNSITLIETLKERFRQQFGLDLHLKVFSDLESASSDNFMKKLSNLKRIL